MLYFHSIFIFHFFFDYFISSYFRLLYLSFFQKLIVIEIEIAMFIKNLNSLENDPKKRAICGELKSQVPILLNPKIQFILPIYFLMSVYNYQNTDFPILLKTIIWSLIEDFSIFHFSLLLSTPGQFRLTKKRWRCRLTMRRVSISYSKVLIISFPMIFIIFGFGALVPPLVSGL